MEEYSKINKNMQRKPKKNHPWRTAAPSEALKYAAETTEQPMQNNLVRGSGRDPWNK